MITDISASGVTARLTASKTFPNGIDLNNWASGTSPFDSPEVTVAGAEMNMNGYLHTNTAPTPRTITLAFPANSDEDNNLAALADQNLAGRGRRVAGDVIQLSFAFPNGKTVRYTDGLITAYKPSVSTGTDGKMTDATYTFTFADSRVSGV